MEKNNNMWIWVGVVVIVGVIIFLIFKNKNIVSPNVDQSNNSGTVNEPESVLDTTGQTTGAVPVSISYANALIQYADRRIQLDTVCQAHPNMVTYKDNTGIMIDNRSPNTRTVKIGTTFTMKPYSFKIVVLPDIYLQAKTILVDCDSSQNVATILVQE